MRIVLGDITKMDTDAIVNAAVSDLSPCPGICSAIFAAADTEELKKACRKIGRCRIGHAVVTPSCGLPSKIIFHVAGAGWYGGVQRERMLLEECYRRALQKALLYNCRTVAVPLIFSGDCHMPRAESIRIAGKVIREFEVRHPDIEVTLVLYKRGSMRWPAVCWLKISQTLLKLMLVARSRSLANHRIAHLYNTVSRRLVDTDRPPAALNGFAHR